MTSLTVSVRRSTSPTVRSKFSTIEMLVRVSICSGTFACRYMNITHRSIIHSYCYSYLYKMDCVCRQLGSNSKEQPLTAEQRVSTMKDMVQSIRSEVSHCPSLPHVLKARLDCEAAHGHDWLAVSPPRVRGQVTKPLGSSSGGQNGPAAV